MNTNETRRVRLPALWANDALERFVDLGQVAKTSRRYIWVEATSDQIESALADAKRCADPDVLSGVPIFNESARRAAGILEHVGP